MMQTLARDFLAAEYPDKVLKAMVKDEKGYTPGLWKKMQEMNLVGLSLPEQYGGVGDFLDLIVVMEEMGKACFLSPYFATIALAAPVILAAGTPEQQKKYISAFAEGKKIATVAVAEASGKYSMNAINTTAQKKDNGYILHGEKFFVPDGQNADYIICAARTADAGDGITLFIVEDGDPGLKVNPLKTIGGDKQAQVILDNVKVPAENVLGEENCGRDYLDIALQRANVARCAEMVGMAAQALKLTLDYAKERNAFGHPIGAFQAIQHRCADMQIDVEGSRFLTYQAAWKINSFLPADKEVAAAKAWVSQACRRVMVSAHQIHGAIGFTEDHVLHYYTKRMRSYEFSFGGADAQLEKLAELYK